MNQPHKLVLPIAASHKTAEEQQKRLEWLEAWKGLPPLVTKSDVNQKKDSCNPADGAGCK
jgi:hypothetical protein